LHNKLLCPIFCEYIWQRLVAYLYKVLFSITIQELEEPILFKYMLICSLEKMLRNEKLAIFFTVLFCLFNLLSRMTLPFSPENFKLFSEKILKNKLFLATK
jgi:hypothetical protein